jgi:hypothetical protein
MCACKNMRAYSVKKNNLQNHVCIKKLYFYSLFLFLLDNRTKNAIQNIKVNNKTRFNRNITYATRPLQRIYFPTKTHNLDPSSYNKSQNFLLLHKFILFMMSRWDFVLQQVFCFSCKKIQQIHKTYLQPKVVPRNLFLIPRQNLE